MYGTKGVHVKGVCAGKIYLIMLSVAFAAECSDCRGDVELGGAAP